MTVVDGSFGGKLSNGVPDAEKLPEPIKKHMTMNCCLNSKVGQRMSIDRVLRPKLGHSWGRSWAIWGRRDAVFKLFGKTFSECLQ